MKSVLNIFLISNLLLATACATQGKSVALGAAAGAGTGMAIGAIADPGRNGEFRTRNVVVGGTLGAMAGIIAGGLLHSNIEKQKKEAFAKGQTDTQVLEPSDVPNLIPAQWKAEVVGRRRVGNRVIPRHIEYIISEPARWEDAE